jgi:hypothetical protein
MLLRRRVPLTTGHEAVIRNFSLAFTRRTIHSASSMVQAFPGPQDVVGVRRWRVRCGLPTIREFGPIQSIQKRFS